MIWVITTCRYPDDGHHEDFEALVEHEDLEPGSVLDAWARARTEAERKFEAENPRPKFTDWPGPFDPEEDWVAFVKKKRAGSQFQVKWDQFKAELDERLGEGSIDALLKAGFRPVAHREHSL